MVRVAFCIGGYPPEEFKRRADLALSYANAEIQVGIINVEASPYFYGITPTEIQLVAPAFIDAYRRAEKEGYDAVVPLGMLDLAVDGGRSAVEIPIVGPMEPCLHVAALLGDRFGLIIFMKNCSPLTALSCAAMAWKIALSVLARAASTYPTWLRTATKSCKTSSMKQSG